MIGYFNFTGLENGPGYNTFYKTAVKSLGRDPNRELAFAAVTDALSGESDYRVTEFPSARLLLWNESLVKQTKTIIIDDNDSHIALTKKYSSTELPVGKWLGF